MRLVSAALSTPPATILDLPAGLHDAVPVGLYHQRIPGVVSKSALDLVHRSPAHYRAWLDGAEEEATPALLFGAATHCAVLEPDVFARDYAVEPAFGDCRKTENKARRDAWRAANAGKLLLSPEDKAAIDGIVKALREHPLASRMLTEGASEVTLRWRDAGTGLECKGRADHYFPRLGLALDLKTTEDARPSSFRKSVANYGYHRQDAFYRDGFAAVGAPLEHFVFVVCEKKPPHLVALYTLDANAIRRGRLSVMQDMSTLAECFETDEWPGYSPSIETLSLPTWAE